MRGEKAFFLLDAQGHIATFRRFCNIKRKEHPNSRVDVKLLANHLEGFNVTPSAREQLRRGDINTLRISVEKEKRGRITPHIFDKGRVKVESRNTLKRDRRILVKLPSPRVNRVNRFPR